LITGLGVSRHAGAAVSDEAGGDMLQEEEKRELQGF
jgi:hypothetical protein